MGYIVLLVTMFGSAFGILWLNHNVFCGLIDDFLFLILLTVASVAIGNICMMLWFKFEEYLEREKDD